MLISEQYADNESPVGDMDGSNKEFTLNNTPNPSNSLEVFINGAIRIKDVDYTATNGTITFVHAPLTDDILKVNYRYK